MPQYCVYSVASTHTNTNPQINAGDIVCVNCPANQQCKTAARFRVRDAAGNEANIQARLQGTVCRDCPPNGKRGFTFAPGCLITTTVFGSEMQPEVELLQHFRDGVIRETRWGERFFGDYFEVYDRVSPEISDHIEEHPETKEVLRWSVMRPWLNYLKLLLARPREWKLEGVDAELRTFLEGMRGEMDAWLDEIPSRRGSRGCARRTRPGSSGSSSASFSGDGRRRTSTGWQSWERSPS